MASGVSSNTLEYSRRLKAGVRKMEVEATKRAENYVNRMVQVEDETYKREGEYKKRDKEQWAWLRYGNVHPENRFFDTRSMKKFV